MKYFASVSGGKDSVYMLLNVIFKNPDKYPLDTIVYYDTGIDYPFIEKVIDYVEAQSPVPVLRFKPKRSWEETYYRISKKTGDIYGFPTMVSRWCLSTLKLDSEKQVHKYFKDEETCKYIGYCVNETKRYSHKIGLKSERYPLVEENIEESTILAWAREQPIFNDYYVYNNRCGCMYCPMSTQMNRAYLLKYYPEQYEYMFEKIRETEAFRKNHEGKDWHVLGKDHNADWYDNRVKTVWLPKLELMEKQKRLF